MSEQEYIQNNYGECELGSGACYHGSAPACLKNGWLGNSCKHWRPTPATTFAELSVWQKTLAAKSSEVNAA